MVARGIGLVLVSLLLVACERPPVESEQTGFRGTGMQQVTNPRLARAADVIPEALPAAPDSGPLAKDVYENVPLLGHLPIAQFTRLMQAMTSWVAPEEGCAYCHTPGESLAADTAYPKVVSRRMLEMTMTINEAWPQHVGTTGVTCYTCHRGKNVPDYGWYQVSDDQAGLPMVGHDAGQNKAADVVGVTSLPYDPFTSYLDGAGQIRIIGERALPSPESNASILATEQTYALMMHLSQALGVNCTFCHNSRSFSVWEEGSPKRSTAWHALQLVRELNADYLASVKTMLPPERLGPHGDVQKINCMTCHQGASKPLNGVSMLIDYPELTAAK